MAAQPSSVSALGRALVQQGRLVQADANAIQMEAVKAGISFVQQLVQVKKLTAKEVSLFAAQTFGQDELEPAQQDLTLLVAEEAGRAAVRRRPRAGWCRAGTRVRRCPGRAGSPR